MKKQTTIVLAGGGSGGHVTPLVAVATKLKQQHPELVIRYIGGRNDAIAKELIIDNGLADASHRIFSGKFRRFSGFKGIRKLKLWRNYIYNIRDFFTFSLGLIQAFGILVFKRPKIIFSKGGYPAMPVCLVARVLRIPVITHDSDAISGLTHRFVDPRSGLRLFGVKPKKLKSNWRYVGVPVDESYFQQLSADRAVSIKQSYGITSQQLVLVTGGGLGSRNLNEAAVNLVPKLTPKQQILVVSGSKFYQYTLELADKLTPSERKKIIIVEFTRDMSSLLRLADVVITRAGATALAEVSAGAKPTIIVPNPLLPGGHQIHNSQVYIEQNAAVIISDYGRTLDQDSLNVATVELLNNKSRRQELSHNIKKLAVNDSLDMVVESIEEFL